MGLPPFHVHLEVILLLAGVEVGYLLAVRRGRVGSVDAGDRRRIVLFSLGMLALLAAVSWPIHDLAEDLFSVHMVQHLLFELVAPPLLIAGMPARLLRGLLRPRPVEVVIRFITRPLVALIVFNAVLLLIHWPAVVELQLLSEVAHDLLHLLMLASGLVMWWPVMSPLPEMPALSPPAQMMYLFFQSLAPTIPASFLTFGSTLLYPAYATAPRVWGISALSDQLVAGLIMKIAGGLYLWGFIAVIFFRWHDREEREGWDALALHGVQRDVRAGLAKKAEPSRP